MTKDQIKAVQILVDQQTDQVKSIREEMSKVIVGQKNLVDRLLVALICQGHILLEGVPGLAKTTAISTLAQIMHVKFQRIQFTPDLLPSDLTGSRVFNLKDHSFYVKKGPIFSNFVLADEINRSPAKIQSALLEAMQERQVTIGEETFELINPFFVMATQNPLEQEGTYPLPEAQVDRFLLKVVLDYPTEEEEIEIMNLAEKKDNVEIKSVLTGDCIMELHRVVDQVYMDDSIKRYIRDLVFASRYPKPKGLQELDGLIAYGGSPRASISLMQTAKAMAFLNNRAYVVPEDVKEIAMDVLRHRVIPTYEAEAEGITSEHLVDKILGGVKVP